MDLQSLAGDLLDSAINSKPSGRKRPTIARRNKSSTVSKAADMLNTDNLGKAASDVVSAPNKVEGLKKAATSLLDKDGDGSVVDDVISGFFK
jgi:hypothetical protein